MKSASKHYLFGILISIFLFGAFHGCTKDNLSLDLKESDVVAKAHTLELQHAYFLETLISGWDSLILPYGIKSQILDQKLDYKKFKISNDKRRLFGDYIERKGNFNFEIFYVNGQPDSVVCYFESSDSFSIFSSNGQYIIEGHLAIKVMNSMNHNIHSNLVLTIPKSDKIILNSHGIVERVLKAPTMSQFEDGFTLTSKSTIVNQTKNLTWNSQCNDLLKTIDGPNFPISGNIRTQLNGKENIEIDFNAFNDFAYDKIAKANQKSTEWIFDIQ